MSKSVVEDVLFPPLTIAQARAGQKWSRADLAQLAKMSVSNVADLETGRNKNPSHALVQRLVKAFRGHGYPGMQADGLIVPGVEEEEMAVT